ncbi:MAG TPA: (d)CMP kinase, partial [Thiotrichales bacterium]|nr:(d)CMP kinase [Thiotrichales bacterium]
MNSEIPVICLDGTSGVGKGTICLIVAKNLGWHILDSGSLYRLTALKASREKVLDNERRLAEVAENLDVCYREDQGELKIYLDNEEVSNQIRSEECGAQASVVAAVPAVRAALLARQRGFLQPPGLVADGRDMGTVVFPNAPLKIFLTASVEERAQRRYKQLKEKGIDVNLPSLVEDLSRRDERDMNRATAPLKPA